MAQKKEVAEVETEPKVSYKNDVKVQGFLKEVNLTASKTSKGSDTISGYITVAFDQEYSLKVEYYAFKYKKDSTVEGTLYKSLSAFLPGTALGDASIVALMQNDPNLTYEQAQGVATKVDAGGFLEERAYFSTKDNAERSICRIKGLRLDVATHLDTFYPHNEIKVQGFVEKKIDNPEAKQVTLSLLLPKFNGAMDRVSFVTPSVNDNTSFQIILSQDHQSKTVKTQDVREKLYNFFNSNIAIGDTILVTASRRDAAIQQLIGNPNGASSLLGGLDVQYKTDFVHENVLHDITPQATLREGDKGAITRAMAKNGLALRQASIDASKDKPSKGASAGAGVLGLLANDPSVVSAIDGVFSGSILDSTPSSDTDAPKDDPLSDDF